MNVIQWLYKKEQVQTTLSKIIQWLKCVGCCTRTYLLPYVRKTFCQQSTDVLGSNPFDFPLSAFSFKLSPYLTTFVLNLIPSNGNPCYHSSYEVQNTTKKTGPVSLHLMYFGE